MSETKSRRILAVAGVWVLLLAAGAALYKYVVAPALRDKEIDETGTPSRFSTTFRLGDESVSADSPLRSEDFRRFLTDERVRLEFDPSDVEPAARLLALSESRIDGAVFTLGELIQGGHNLGDFPATIVLVVAGESREPEKLEVLSVARDYLADERGAVRKFVRSLLRTEDEDLDLTIPGPLLKANLVHFGILPYGQVAGVEHLEDLVRETAEAQVRSGLLAASPVEGKESWLFHAGVLREIYEAASQPEAPSKEDQERARPKPEDEQLDREEERRRKLERDFSSDPDDDDEGGPQIFFFLFFMFVLIAIARSRRKRRKGMI